MNHAGSSSQGKVPGAGLHRQLGMVEQTGILRAECVNSGSSTSYSPASNRTDWRIGLVIRPTFGFIQV